MQPEVLRFEPLVWWMFSSGMIVFHSPLFDFGENKIPTVKWTRSQ